MKKETNIIESQNSALQQNDVTRSAFDVEKHNGNLIIYTFYWNEFGEKVWCGNTISETELRRIVEGMKRFL